MGISIALSPTQGNPAFSKDAITNASFRARRLPGKCQQNNKTCYTVNLIRSVSFSALTLSVWRWEGYLPFGRPALPGVILQNKNCQNRKK